MNQIQKITSLVQELNGHRHAYYNLNAPTITDKEYDQLFDELQQLETETGFILSNSPTQLIFLTNRLQVFFRVPVLVSILPWLHPLSRPHIGRKA